MGYMHIENLYRRQEILLFRKCFAMEKVHGTSANVSWRDGKAYFSSGGASSTQFKNLFDEEALTKIFTEKIGVAQEATVYGEAYGGKILAMSATYGKELKFVAFDVKIRDSWLSVPQAHDFVTSLGLEFVHYVEIPTDLEAINRERDADSVQAQRNGIPGKIREGVVLRPLIELRMNDGERLIIKHKRDEFRETAEVRDVSVDPSKLKILTDATATADEWVTSQRLLHVLDKISQPHDIKQTPKLFPLMLEDVLREGSGEFVDTPEVRKAITKKTAELFKLHLQSFLVDVK